MDLQQATSNNINYQALHIDMIEVFSWNNNYI
jgi:hypothetical protein